MPNLLMVEPNIILAHHFTQILEQQGWSVAHVESVQDALTELETLKEIQAVLVSPKVFPVAEHYRAYTDEQKDLEKKIAVLLRQSDWFGLLPELQENNIN
jgi:CheY-like chemotaxis protein